MIRYVPISGFHGVISGCLVGVKQLMPDQEIALLYFLKFRAKVSKISNLKFFFLLFPQTDHFPNFL